MKKFLSFILASIILAVPMISVSCFAATGVGQRNSSAFVEANGNSKMSSFFKFSLTAVAAALASAILLKEFSPEGNFGESAAKTLLKSKDYISNLKQYIAGLCVERNTDGKCANTLGASLAEVKHIISNEWNENISGPISNYWNNSSAVKYLMELKNALANNVNSFCRFSTAQAN